MAFTLRIGTRPSPLAMAQAAIVRARIESSTDTVKTEIVPIRTSGDKMTSGSLAEIGGKGLFIRELEQALTERTIDVAVHSMKDLPAVLAHPFRIAAVPERDNPRDALITRKRGGFAALPRGAHLGTSSLRRRFQALRIRGDLVVKPLRGNVDTRLTKLASGELDAIIVAIAGLKRLGRLDALNFEELGERDFVPAGGQGALAIEALADQAIGGSAALDAAIGSLEDPRAAAETTAERAFLAAIGASCVSPVGAKGALDAGALILSAMLFSADGSRELADTIAATCSQGRSPASIGVELAQRMLARGAGDLIGRSG